MPRSWRSIGVRVRITLFSAVIVGVALVAGANLLTGLLRNRLDDSATTAATLRARDIAGLAASGGLPSTLALPGEESAVVQVISASRDVLASSRNIEGEPPITTRRPSPGSELVTTLVVTAIDEHDPMRLVAVVADTPDGPVTVYATESLERSEDTVQSVIRLLTLAIPALVALVAALTWWAVGRTLRPVRAITATLAEITATDLHRRVPTAYATDEIGTLANTVNDTLSRLDTAVERQRRFIADASHELRGPLAALRGDLEISINHPHHTDWTTVAADTLTDVDRLQHLTEDLLTLARLGADPIAGGTEPSSLTALVRNELDSRSTNAAAIIFHEPSTPAFVIGSPGHLRRVIRNLVDNAAHHAMTRVDVRIARDDDHVVLQVIDDGPGIPVADRTRVLEPFVRLDTARTRDTGGTGLGLAIVVEIVRAHHGTIALEDTEPTGLTVTVRLPDPTTGESRRGTAPR